MLWNKDFIAVSKNILLLLSGRSENEMFTSSFLGSYTEIKYSNTLIKQVLLYIALVDIKGKINYVNLERLASEIGCSIETAQNNNTILQRAGVLKWKILYRGSIEVEFKIFLRNIELQYNVVEYNDLSYNNSPVEDYIFLSTERIRELVEIKNINSLRTALHFQVLETEILSKNGNKVYLSLGEIKQFLPKKYQYKKYLNDMFRELKHLFDISVYDTKEKLDSFFYNEVSNMESISTVEGGGLIRINVREATPFKIHLESIRGKNKDMLIIDEYFWENVEYMQFYSDHLYIYQQDKLSARYLHYKYLKDTGYYDTEYINIETLVYKEKFKEFDYVFPKDNGAALKYLWDNSKKRKKWKETEDAKELKKI